jgi:hypothetical protein
MALSSLHPIAEAHVRERDEKECGDRCYEHEIEHFNFPGRDSVSIIGTPGA